VLLAYLSASPQTPVCLKNSRHVALLGVGELLVMLGFRYAFAVAGNIFVVRCNGCGHRPTSPTLISATDSGFNGNASITTDGSGDGVYRSTRQDGGGGSGKKGQDAGGTDVAVQLGGKSDASGCNQPLFAFAYSIYLGYALLPLLASLCLCGSLGLMHHLLAQNRRNECQVAIVKHRIERETTAMGGATSRNDDRHAMVTTGGKRSIDSEI
jgi:hypothetical protein